MLPPLFYFAFGRLLDEIAHHFAKSLSLSLSLADKTVTNLSKILPAPESLLIP
jgi:hypothetical protein